MENNAVTLRRLSQEYGVLPHELLRKNIIDFDFDLAVTFFADIRLQEQLKNRPKLGEDESKKNEFASSDKDSNLTLNQFNSIFGKVLE